MGNCVAVSKRQDAALQVGLSVGNEAGHRGNESTVKARPGVLSGSGAELNVKEEMFFDSQAWLESDCEDYFSVCDETPSFGNSPIHSKNFRELPQLEKPLPVIVALTEPPLVELKRLHELFQESFRANPDENKDIVSSPTKKVKSAESPPCCIPRLVRNLSFGERKKSMKTINGSLLQSHVMKGKA